MIEWPKVARSLGYSDDVALWKDLYETKKLSIAQISKKLDVSRNVVRENLAKAGVVMRKQGGPNNARVVLTDDLLDRIRKDGVAAVARDLGLDYTTLYKRLRLRGMSVASLRSVVPGEPPTTDIPDTPIEGEDSVTDPSPAESPKTSS